MASSATYTNTFRTGYAIRIVWNINSQSISDNSSNVTASVQLVSLGSSYTINSTVSKSGSLTINGTKYPFTFTAALSGSQTKTLFTKTVDIPHNADGIKSCSFSATAGINVTLSGTYFGNVTVSGNGSFNTIARASSISSVTSSIAITGSNEVTVNISRASSSFTHTVNFVFGSYSYSQTGIGTSTSYKIPLTWINAIPNATSGTATVQVTTYSGSTKIGNTVSKTFTVTVPTTFVPTISSVSISEAVSGLNAQFGGYVQDKSKLKVTVSAAGVYSSTIKTYKTTFLGVNYNSASFTTGLLTQSGTLTLSVTVTDSRGRTASTTKSVTVAAYAVPTITSFKTVRCLSNGTEDNNGTYLKSVVNYTISSVNSKNTASYTIEYKLKTATTWTAVNSGTSYAVNSNIISSSGIIGTDNSYDVRLTIKDFFTTTTALSEVPTAFTLLDFNASGKGVAFGKVSEKNALEVNMDIYDKFDTQIRNGLAYYLSNGGIDANTTIEELVLTTTNVPISGSFFYVRTLFYSAKTATSNRTQIAYPYNKATSTYCRYYINGTGWSDWLEQPVVIDQGTSGIWTYKKYSDKTAECIGKIDVSSVDVTSALGNWYRGANLYEATTYPYPVTFTEPPVVEMMFQTTNSSSGLLWTFSASTANAKSYLPQCYLIRPVTGSGLIGYINVIAKGKVT